MKKIYTIFIIVLAIATTSFYSPEYREDNNIDVKTKIVNFYPNPATSVIYFEFSKPIERGHTIIIYNFIGKKVAEINVSGNKLNVELDAYYRGVYIFQLKDKTGKILETGKFQVVK